MQNVSAERAVLGKTSERCICIITAVNAVYVLSAAVPLFPYKTTLTTQPD